MKALPTHMCFKTLQKEAPPAWGQGARGPTAPPKRGAGRRHQRLLHHLTAWQGQGAAESTGEVTQVQDSSDALSGVWMGHGCAGRAVFILLSARAHRLVLFVFPPLSAITRHRLDSCPQKLL